MRKQNKNHLPLKKNHKPKLLRNVILFFCFLSGNMISTFASDPNFTTINMDNGLSNNTINTIYKDSTGFVWLGTQNGLNRFDGINIDVYSEFNNETVFTICETDSIFMYVGTNFGLKVLNRKSGLIEKVKLPDTSSTTIRFLKKKNDILYICTDNGLFIKENDSIHKIPIENISYLTAIIIDHNNNYWLASYNGLFFYNTQTQETEKFLYSSTNTTLNKFYCLAIIDTQLYIGSENAGILTFDTRTKSFNRFINLGNDCVLNLHYQDDHLYVGTNGSGLKIISLKNQQVKTIAHDPNNVNSISSNAVYSFLLDNETFWIGTFFAGFNYNISSNKTFGVYSLPNQFNTFDLNVRSFWIGDEDYKITGTRNGFFYISEDKSDFREFSSEKTDILKSNIILNIYPWNHRFLIGTYSGGLYIFDPRSMTISEFREDQLFRNNSFYSFTTDKNNRIWFGTLNGVICFDPDTEEYTHFTSSSTDLIDNSVFSILRDSRDRIWIGTAEGLCMYDNETNKIQKNILPKDLESNLKMIRHIYEDSSGDIWICSEKNGLVRMNADLSVYRHYTDKNLLPDIFAISTIEDNYGYLWIATAKGLIRFDKQTEDYSIFSSSDGIPAQMFNHVVQKDKEGMIWWANEKGLVYTLPTEKLKTENTHPVFITAVYIGGKRIYPDSKSLKFMPEYASTIELGAGQDNINIRFSGLTFGYFKSEIYEYKLDGKDTQWKKKVGDNQISYTDLKAGNYQLHIRKAGSLEPEKVILITKYRSYSIYIWIGIFLFVILIGIYFYRIQFLKFSSMKRMVVESVKKQADSPEKYQKSKLEEAESSTIRDALLNYMENNQPYLNSKLKLAEVSVAIKFPQTKISQVLNQSLNTSFTDFINKYRVEEFKKRSQSGAIQQYTLTALSEECGFSSRSSFFHVFKKITGQTPLEFLKESGIILDKDK